MTIEYKDWDAVKVVVKSRDTGEQLIMSAEQFYQDIKERLIKEVAAYSPHLMQDYAMLVDMKDEMGKS